MFRGTQRTQLDAKNFGAGSVVGEGSTKYLVVCQGCGVRLLNLSTFELVGTSVVVEDPNFLSAGEVSSLAAVINCTRSDLDYDAKGMKK